MNTRKQYLENKCSHREYYAQFVDKDVLKIVRNEIGIDAIKSSKDEHLNDIPMKLWDGLSGCIFKGSELISPPKCSRKIYDKAIELGEGGISPATMVCIFKEAARQLIEFILMRDEKIIFEGTENECYEWILKHTPFSSDWAIKYEGYKIIGSDNALTRHGNNDFKRTMIKKETQLMTDIYIPYDFNVQDEQY